MSTETPTNEEQIHRATSDDGTEIVGHVYGQGPALVFVPSPLGDEATWNPVVPFLDEQFTCYTMSLRGRGSSEDHPDQSTERHVQDVVAFAESIGESVTLVGESGSGILVLGAAQHATAVNSVIVHEPFMYEALDEEEIAEFGELFERMATVAAEGDLSDAARGFLEGVATDEEMAAMAESNEFEKLAPSVPLLLKGVEQTEERPTDPSSLATITEPVLLLKGTRSGPILHAGVTSVAEHVPSAEVREIADVGHLAPTIAPEPLADQIREFLADEQVSTDR
ncbi:alpha/beta fold hydrolase [Natronococcus occultus]|uniref:Putative hydrolase or acyltransferase of alpha/beta superfamily n=1 Tax=Natronococcus occultus SP4 TaxID=694430 RepID=L0K1Y6_9EURY|nr:alpha/beta hydrolase [Natronococcus occultus]AGB39297.1 putative hydrolase or acyltransferase of alpha/beta superfamily [Natronococcus occultus SP4]